MHKPFLLTACIFGALSVALGAFGAHALKNIVPAVSLVTFETGVRYQFYHVFALLAVGILHQHFPCKKLKLSGYFFITGIALFSGSLYLLTFLQPDFKWLGAITPFGGIAFILGWLQFALAINSKKSENKLSAF